MIFLFPQLIHPATLAERASAPSRVVELAECGINRNTSFVNLKTS
jgi:hypothetical protein